VAVLRASDAAHGDRFGATLSISGDTVLVGAPRDDDRGSNSGGAYVFVRDRGGPEAWGQVAKLRAPGGAAGDGFGSSVSLSGDTAVVGAPGHSTATVVGAGAVHVFGRNQGGWRDRWGFVVTYTAADPSDSDLFGTSVGVSDHVGVVTGGDSVYLADWAPGGLAGEISGGVFQNFTTRRVAISSGVSVVGVSHGPDYHGVAYIVY
jgi:hypothetical protein